MILISRLVSELLLLPLKTSYSKIVVLDDHFKSFLCPKIRWRYTSFTFFISLSSQVQRYPRIFLKLDILKESYLNRKKEADFLHFVIGGEILFKSTLSFWIYLKGSCMLIFSCAYCFFNQPDVFTSIANWAKNRFKKAGKKSEGKIFKAQYLIYLVQFTLRICNAFICNNMEVI